MAGDGIRGTPDAAALESEIVICGNNGGKRESNF